MKRRAVKAMIEAMDNKSTIGGGVELAGGHRSDRLHQLGEARTASGLALGLVPVGGPRLARSLCREFGLGRARDVGPEFTPALEQLGAGDGAVAHALDGGGQQWVTILDVVHDVAQMPSAHITQFREVFDPNRPGLRKVGFEFHTPITPLGELVSQHQSMYTPGSHEEMATEALSRLDLLKRLCRDRLLVKADGVTPSATKLGLAIDRKPNYCSDLLLGRRSFGEEIARHIEEKLGLPRLFLDGGAPWPLASDAPSSARPLSPIAIAAGQMLDDLDEQYRERVYTLWQRVQQLVADGYQVSIVAAEPHAAATPKPSRRTGQ